MNWTRHPGFDKFVTWEHSSGWKVTHCGHPTANWPYFLQQPGRAETIVSFNGRGFKSAEIGRAVVEGILAGEIRVTRENCVRGIARTENATAHAHIIDPVTANILTTPEEFLARKKVHTKPRKEHHDTNQPQLWS